MSKLPALPRYTQSFVQSGIAHTVPIVIVASCRALQQKKVATKAVKKVDEDAMDVDSETVTKPKIKKRILGMCSV